MKAITMKEFGNAGVLELTEVAKPELRSTDLLIKNCAAGVNRADLLQRQGHYGKQNFGDSSIMGLEISGEVVAVGDAVSGFNVGDRVMGIVGGGAYAEFSRINAQMAMRIPACLSYVEAAAIPEAFVTAHEATLHLGKLKKENSVLIHAAASGVGSAAVQLAHVLGARVFATAGESKLSRVRELGADVAIDYKVENFAEKISEQTSGNGVDVIIDFIGAPYFEKNILSLAEAGRLIQVGLLGGSKDAKVPLDRILYKRLQIMGTVMKSRTIEEKQAMTKRFSENWLEHFAEKRLKPVVDRTFPLSQAKEAHERMEASTNIGKIILTM